MIISNDISSFITCFTDTQMQLDPTVQGPIGGLANWGTLALNICSVF